MMKLIFKILFLITSFPLSTRAQVDGLMYWEIRQRFLDKYIRVGEGHGVSIPVTWIREQNDGPDILVFEDESTRQPGSYIAVLAPENFLLRSSDATPKKPSNSTRLQLNCNTSAIH